MSSSLIKSIKLTNLCLKNNKIVTTAVRNHWNKDFKPAVYPKSEADRAAAAERYNLALKDYEPYPDNGNGYGDYPKLPLVSSESKNPYYPYDDPAHKRNFGEPIHLDYDVIREDRYDVSANLRFPLRSMVATFFGVIGTCFLIYWAAEHCKMFPAVIPKQLPEKGKKHYTFEPAE